eukprot:s2111_g1.t1
MAWQEALRLHPTLTALFRQAEVDTTLGGKYNIPKGSVVQVSQLALAHSEDIWGPDVMSFSPERMAKGYPEMHFPFGFGGRVCIGKRLAYVEGVYFLAFLVKNFMLRVEEGSPAPKSRSLAAGSCGEAGAISLGCATALMYGRRAELLLRLGRPRAARRDCSAALALNPDSGKAFKTRARALVKLKLWKDAHADFQEGLKIDYDDATYEESVKVAGKMKEISAVATARRVRNEEAEEKRKQQQAKAEQEQRMRQLQAEQAARAEALI